MTRFLYRFMNADILNFLSSKWNDPLLRNSLIILVSSLVSAGIGFLFWVFAARMFSTNEVGIASAVVSSMLLIISISTLGFDQVIIRFFPDRDRNVVFSSGLTIVIIMSLTVGIIYLLTIGWLAPNLFIVRSYWILFLFTTVFYACIGLDGVALIAIRKPHLYLFQTLLSSSRIFLLFFFTGIGALGIILSFGIASVISLGFSSFLLVVVGIKFVSPDLKFLKSTFSFSSTNYASSILMAAPTMILPIIVLNKLGPEDVAIYYIVSSMALLVYSIPGACTTSLFVEGCHGHPLPILIKKTVLISTLLVSIAIVIFFIFGNLILSIVGVVYAREGFNLLMLLTFASYFVIIFQLQFAIEKIRKRNAHIALYGLLFFIISILSSVIMVEYFGLIGLGYANIISYGLLSVAIQILRKKDNAVIC